MQEPLNNTNQQEHNAESQACDSQNTQEGQASFCGIEHGDQRGDSGRDPFANAVKHVQHSVQYVCSLCNQLLSIDLWLRDLDLHQGQKGQSLLC